MATVRGAKARGSTERTLPVTFWSLTGSGESRYSLPGLRRRIEPARLDLILRNHDLHYTPGNPRSPLAGNLTAGRRVWAALAYLYDDFTGPDGTDVNGRVVPFSDGKAWVKGTTGPAGLELSAGRVRPTAGAGGAIYTLDFGEADAHIGFVFRRASNGQSGVVLRFLNQWDYLRVRFGDTGTVLEDVTFGFPSPLRRGDPLVTGADYFIEIELHGSSVRLYATDLDGGTMDRRQILDGGGNAGNTGATRHGFWHDGSTAAADDMVDNFGGWRSFFHGSLVRISPERDPELGNICRCQARDDLALLGPLPLYNLFNQGNLSSGVIADGILTWAGFSPNYRRVEGGQTLIATEPRALWRLLVSPRCAPWRTRKMAVSIWTAVVISGWKQPPTGIQAPIARLALPCGIPRRPAPTSRTWPGTRASRTWKIP